MKDRFTNSISAIALFAALAPAQLAAQHTRYKLIDLETFGGPASYFSFNPSQVINGRGVLAGYADTRTLDPFPFFCFNPDCFVSHAFQSRNGVVTDLGTLPGGPSSQAFWISPNGLIAGISQNGQTDPLIPGFPEFRAVLWHNGGITDLGTLEGGHESLAFAINNAGQAVGPALNTVPDSFCLFAPGFCTTQTRAFLWQNGMMQDLGTLGGPDALAFFVNQRGQVAGYSYTNSTPNPATGIPTTHPFLWQAGKKMTDLGSLGGNFANPVALNDRGQVVGVSDLVGDSTFHPFLWTTSGPMQDLGTLGGNNGITNWINDAGDIVGNADLPGPSPQIHDAVLWRHGTMIDLGTLPGDSCSNALYVNSRGQVVGTSESRDLCLIPTAEHAFLWEDGGPMIDLNTLVPVGSSLELTFAYAINDRGEIAGTGVPPGCAPKDVRTCGHAYVLIPCREGDERCGDSPEGPAAATQSTPALVTQQPTPATPANPALRGRGILDQLRGRRFPDPE